MQYPNGNKNSEKMLSLEEKRKNKREDDSDEMVIEADMLPVFESEPLERKMEIPLMGFQLDSSEVTSQAFLPTQHQPLSSANASREKQELMGEILRKSKEINGSLLRTLREQMNVSLDEISRSTKIQKRHLVSIENDRFESLPALVYFRGFLRAYLEHLGLKRPDIVDAITEKYQEQRTKKAV